MSEAIVATPSTSVILLAPAWQTVPGKHKRVRQVDDAGG